MQRYGWIRAGLVVILGAATPADAEARTLRVQPEGSEYSSLWDAVEAASPGDTVSVGPGRKL